MLTPENPSRDRVYEKISLLLKKVADRAIIQNAKNPPAPILASFVALALIGEQALLSIVVAFVVPQLRQTDDSLALLYGA